MNKFGSFLLEMLRLCLLLIFTLLILGGIERLFYQFILDEPTFHWSMGLGNMIIFFVLYRNHFQFKGWYKSESNKKLSSTTTKLLATIAVMLILFPVWF